MTANDFTEMLDTIATVCKPLKADIERLEAENRNIRQRLTVVEDKLIRMSKEDQ